MQGARYGAHGCNAGVRGYPLWQRDLHEVIFNRGYNEPVHCAVAEGGSVHVALLSPCRDAARAVCGHVSSWSRGENTVRNVDAWR